MAAATDGETFDRLVVVYLKRMFRCIRAAKLCALWPIREIGPGGRSVSYFCLLSALGHRPVEIKGLVTDKVKVNKRTEVSVRDLQHHQKLHNRDRSCCGTCEPIPVTGALSIHPTTICMTK